MNERLIKTRMSEILNQPVSRLTDEQVLTELVIDSFALIDLVIELQDELDVLLVQDDLKAVKTVGQLIAVIIARSAPTANVTTERICSA